MTLRTRHFRILMIIGLALLVTPVAARVLLRPTGGENSMPLCARSVSADVTISSQFASTTLNLVFQNESPNRMEAEFVYELPKGAVATYFAYWAEDEKVVARIVEKAEAKRIYEKIVTFWNRDPALIEMTGKNTFRARIFPVLPNADLRVEIHIVQALPSDGNAVTYSLPIYDKEALDPLDFIDVKAHVQPDPAIASVSTNYGINVQHGQKGYDIDLSGEEYRPPKDLNIRVARKPEKMHVSLYSAPSGRGDGFFALSLTPDHSVTDASVSISGVKTYDLSPTHFRQTKALQSITVFGRYKGSGSAVVTLKGRAVSYCAPLQFGSAPKAGNLASKLWAAARIRQLSGNNRNRRAVIDLSKRFGMPSKFTSWLAVPKEEMKQYTRDRYSKKLDTAMKPLEKAIAENRRDSEVVPLVQHFRELCKGIGLDPKEEMNNRFEYTMMERLADMLAAGRDETPEARLLKNRITNLFGIDWSSDDYGYAWQAIYKIADELVKEENSATPRQAVVNSLKARLLHVQKLTGKDSNTALRTARESYRSRRPWELISREVDNIRNGKPSGKLSEKDALLLQESNARVMEQASSEANSIASDIARAEYRGGANKSNSALRLQLDRLCAYSGLKSSDLLEKCYESELRSAARELVWAKRVNMQDKKQITLLNAQIVRLEKLTGRSSAPAIKEAEADNDMGDASWSKWETEEKLFTMVTDPSKSATQVNAICSRYNALCKRLGLDPQKELARYFVDRIYYLASDLVEAKSQPHPDEKTIAKITGNLTRVEQYVNLSLAEAAKLSTRPSLWYSLDPIKDELSSELYRDNLNKSRLMRLKKRYTELVALPEIQNPGNWCSRSDHIESYGALLDQAIDLRIELADVEKKAQAAKSKGDKAELARLKSKQDEIKASFGVRMTDMALAARYGDPLISVDAPADALRVLAIMPDGEIKTLQYNTDKARWEARFDIPAYATEGQYLIHVEIFLKDGSLKQLSLRYNVDLTPPTGTGTAVIANGTDNRIRLDVTASEDTARVAALMPWGERVEMSTSAKPGRFYAVADFPEGYKALPLTVSFILTDRAHNRAVITAETTK